MGDLRTHLDDKLAQYRRQTLKNRQTELPASLPNDMKLFDVPDGLVRILDRDLACPEQSRRAAAGIAKKDAEGRKVDVHSLRHTFATMLSQAGVRPRTAQELMRHSPSASLRAVSLSNRDIRLTMTTYTHLGLVDTAGAVEALPSIGAAASPISKKARTATDC